MMGNLYGFRGYYNHSRSKLDKAERFYKKGLTYKMNNPRYYLSYGVLLLNKGEYNEAKELFSNVLVNIPAKENIKITAKMNLALAYWKLKDIDTAIEMLQETHRKHRSGKVYGTLGYLLIEKGDLKKALEYNLEALDYDDEDSVVLDNLGQTYYKMGDIEKAKEFFLKAEQAKGDQAVTLYSLGCIYLEENNKEEAKKKLEKALTCRITPLSTITLDEIESKLQELG